MTPRLGGLFALGLLLRLVFLPAWGTFDVEVQKAWSARAATEGVADIYGPPDRELIDVARARGGALVPALLALEVPRTRFTWGSAEYFVDYPPGSVLVLWAAGKLYALFDPALPNRRAFNAAINLAPLLGSVALALLLRRSAAGPVGETRALAFWLNPAMLLSAPVLGYQDTVLGVFALLATLALIDRRHAWAVGFVVAAGLTKPQAALLLPTLFVVLAMEAAPRVWVRAALAGTLAAGLVLAPWWLGGHLLSALDGCRRPLTQTTLAPLGLNLWWIAGWLADASRHGALTLARIWQVDEFSNAAFDPRPWAGILLFLSMLANMALLARGLKHSRQLLIPLSIVLQVHVYALFGLRVHENHTLLVLMILPLLLGAWSPATRALGWTSAFAFLSLFFAAGLGRRVTRLAQILALRSWTGIDASVLVAFGHMALVAALFVWVARTAKEDRQKIDSRPSMGLRSYATPDQGKDVRMETIEPAGAKCVSCGRPALVTVMGDAGGTFATPRQYCLECAERQREPGNLAQALALFLPGLLIRGGALIGFLALAADYLHIEGKSGFGWKQIAGVEVGVLALTLGAFLRVGFVTVGGLVLMALSVGADYIGVGHSAGLGWKQEIALSVSVSCVIGGLLWQRGRARQSDPAPQPSSTEAGGAKAG